MRCRVASCFGLALVVAACGCGSRNVHRVESELRARETDVRQLRDELDQSTVLNQSLQQELHSLRGELGLPGDGQPPAAYPVRSIALGRQTGGRSNANCPGDDALQVQLVPSDPEGQSIKAPGALLIQVEEISKEGLKRPLSSWEISPDQMRKSWRSGLLTTGYVLNLPWKIWPSTEKLHVSAQFQLTDGRLFGADKDITVRLTPANRRPAPASFPPAPKSTDEGGPPLLPAPRPMEPTKPTPKTPMGDFPGPLLDGLHQAGMPSNPWQKVEPPPPPLATEILRPVPLKRAN